MVQLSLTILEFGQKTLLAAEPSNLMMVLSKDVVGKAMGDAETFKQIIEKLNARFIPEFMIPLSWK